MDLAFASPPVISPTIASPRVQLRNTKNTSTARSYTVATTTLVLALAKQAKYLRRKRIARTSLRVTVTTNQDEGAEQLDDRPLTPRRPRVAVVGAGWGGLGAAQALCENGCEVVLLDGSAEPCGGMRTPSGKPFEAGTRGFWKDYPNMNTMLAEIGVRQDDVFTDFTESAFWSPDGLEATAPVFGSSPELPSPLGQVLASFSRFKRLPLSDRASMVGLLLAMLDFSRDEATFEAYDRMTAHELFIRAGLSRRLVDDFLRPTLLVGLFKPPEELSAAVTMELLYFYALAHQTSFDVRWLKKGTVGETLMQPLVQHLSDKNGFEVRGGCFVEHIDVSEGRVTGLRARCGSARDVLEIKDLDAAVLAVGAGGLRSILRGSPEVAQICPNLSAAGSLQSIDVLSVRLWFDRRIPTDQPANVLSRFKGLRGAGGTFFMLDQLQPDQNALWGGQEPQGSVVACDFYDAGSLLPMSDEAIVKLLIEELLPSAVPAFRTANIVESCVKRFGSAVTWFSPGSFRRRPTLETPIPNLVCAGDWVRMGSREHGAKGLCQERALVSGYEAANSLARRGILGTGHRREHQVIPVREDELQVRLGRVGGKALGALLKPFGLDTPWVR